MEEFRISTVQSELDILAIHRFLSEESSWAKGIPIELVKTSIANSLCFGGFLDRRQVAFARVISDLATFANLVDVFVLPEYRGRGYSKALMTAIVEHPQLQGLRRFTLATGDSHGLYRKFRLRTRLSSRDIHGTLLSKYLPESLAPLFLRSRVWLLKTGRPRGTPNFDRRTDQINEFDWFEN